MSKVSIGRRLSLAFAGGAGLGLLFYWIGELVVAAAAAAPPSSPIIGLAVGVSTATAIALSADLADAAKGAPAEETKASGTD